MHKKFQANPLRIDWAMAVFLPEPNKLCFLVWQTRVKNTIIWYSRSFCSLRSCATKLMMSTFSMRNERCVKITEGLPANPKSTQPQRQTLPAGNPMSNGVLIWRAREADPCWNALPSSAGLVRSHVSYYLPNIVVTARVYSIPIYYFHLSCLVCPPLHRLWAPPPLYRLLFMKSPLIL